MKWILFLMMFTTPPAPPTPPPKTPPKVPVEKVWALQSTTTAEFQSEDACVRAGDRITKSIDIASTLNLRGWCFCESLDATKKCPDEAAEGKSADERTKTILARTPPANVSFAVRSFAPANK
jgi:hypothetical protein